MKPIGRTIAVTLLVAIAAAGPAIAGRPQPTKFSGSFGSRGEISFRLSAGADKAVSRIRIKGIRADCPPGEGDLNFRIYGRTPVFRDRSFAVRSKDGTGGRAFVEGRFSRGYTEVSGAARVHGRFLGLARCDSGKQKYEGASQALASPTQPKFHVSKEAE